MALAIGLPLLILACGAGLADDTTQEAPDPMAGDETTLEWQGWIIADQPERGLLRISAAALSAPGPDLSSGNELLARRAVGEYLAATGRHCQIHSFTEPAFGEYEAGYAC